MSRGKNKKMSKTAKIIKNLRLENQITQSDLAKKLKVNQCLLSAWENGTRKLTIENAIKLSYIYKIPHNIIIDCLIEDAILEQITNKTA